MKDDKVITLLQVKVLPQYRDEIVQVVLQNTLPTRAEAGVEVYYQTTLKDDPNTLLFSRSFHRKPHTIRMCKRSTLRGPSQPLMASSRQSRFVLS